MTQGYFPVITFMADCDEVISQVTQQLITAGYTVLESFDLHSVRAAHSDCTCPHHGTEKCNCQFVVLLVYGNDANPITLTIHSCDQQTELSIVDTPGQQESMQLKTSIQQAIEPSYFKLIDHDAFASPS